MTFLNNNLKHIVTSSPQAWKSLFILAFFVWIASPVFAQNTKGDKPASQGPLIRLPKIKSRHKGGDRPYTRDISGRRRIRTKSKSSANHIVFSAHDPYAGRTRSRITDKAGQPMSRIRNAVPRDGQRAWWGSTTGAPLRVRSSSARRARNNVYSQHGRYVNNPAKRPTSKQKVSTRTVHGETISRVPGDRQKTWTGKIGAASASGPFLIRGRKNVYWGKFSKGERPVTHDLTGRPLLKLNFHSAPIGVGTTDTLKISKRRPQKRIIFSGQAKGTASQRAERAWSGDVSGHPIRRRPAKTGDTGGIYIFGLDRSASKAGDRAAAALPKGGFRSASRRFGNNPLPARTPGIGASGIARVLKKITGRKTPKGGGSASKGWNNGRRPINVRTPGLGALGIGSFRGNFRRGDLLSGFSHEGSGYSGSFKARRQLKGGGSASGFFNNGGHPIEGRQPGPGINGLRNFRGDIRAGGLYAGFSHDGARFTGTIKSRRPPQKAGSISGRYLNNGGRPIDVRSPGVGAIGMGKFQGNFRRGDLFSGFSHEGAGYSGDIKSRRPLRGGGSISGKYLSNGGRPVDVRVPGIGSQGIGNFRGNFRQGDLFSGFSHEGARYSGDIRSRRPLKGGGSVSGKIWNNNREPIPVKGGAPGFDQAARYRGDLIKEETLRDFSHQGYGFSGNIKAKKPQKGGGSISEKIFNNNGHPIEVRSPGSETARASRFSGTFKAKRPEIGGGSISGKIWNNNEKPIDVHPPGSGQADASRYSGTIGSSRFKRNYVQNPRASDASLKKKKPNPNVYLAEGLIVKFRQETYRKKPHAKDNTLPGIGPKKESVRASEFAGAMKMTWNYKHNPSSKENALKVIAPGKAYARINDYQGNLKMKKYNEKDFHPDAQFAHGNRDNVKADRTLLINLKLFWAKMFRKNDTQPAVVKEKEHRPRYDKKEKELWKALYD